MNESANKEKIFGAIFGIIFLFFLLGIFLYKFGTNKDVVVNQDGSEEENAKTALENQFNNPENENDLYKKYVQEIYNIKSQGNEDVESQNKIEQLVSNNQKTLKIKPFYRLEIFF